MQKILEASKIRLALFVLFTVLCLLEALDGFEDNTDIATLLLAILSYNHLTNRNSHVLNPFEKDRNKFFARLIFSLFVGLIFIIGTFVDIVPFDPYTMIVIKYSTIGWSTLLLLVSLKEYRKSQKFTKIIHANLAIMVIIGSLFYF